jgi:hypothetical protein
MKSKTANSISIGPGVLEDIIVKALKDGGHIPANAIAPVVRFYQKSKGTWSNKQVECRVNEAKIRFSQPIDL